MTYQTLNDFNSSGMTGLFQYVATIVPIFIPVMLFTFFVIVVVGSYMSQLRLFGRSSLIQSFAVGSYVTTIAAFILTLSPGLIEGNTQMMVMSVLIAITILSTILLFIPREN